MDDPSSKPLEGSQSTCFYLIKVEHAKVKPSQVAREYRR